MQAPESDPDPGGRNLYRVHRGYAIIDYGYRVGAYEEACRLAKHLAPCPTVVVISVPGDCADAFVRTIGRAVARSFDRIAVKDDGDKRGREVSALLAEAILDERPQVYCTVSDDEQRAIRQTIATMRDREVVFIFTEQAERTAAFLAQLGGVPVDRIDDPIPSSRGR